MAEPSSSSLNLPILSQLNSWVDKTQSHVTAQTDLGKAVHYMANNLSRLERYVDAVFLPIYQNTSKLSIKPLFIGRKVFDTVELPARDAR